jgi:hypothetical protein
MSDSLTDRFPDMRPVSSAPSLSTFHGIGTMLVGRRDVDEETDTYVKTHCFTVLFVPLVALGAYRVADAPGGGWYFLGKVPLSGFARAWNRAFGVLAVVCAGLGGWVAYTRSEDYKAGEALARAERLAEEGDGKQAAELYREVMLGPSSKAPAARERFDALVADPPGGLADAAGVYRVAVELQRQERHTVKDLYARAAERASRGEDGDPAGALEVLEVVAPLAPGPADQLTPRRRLLERLVQKSPGDVDLASRLAVVCAEQADLKRCRAVLAPHEGRLGAREGAAILGHLYGAEGKLGQAEKLLAAYLDSRLPQARSAEQSFQAARASAEARIFQSLREGKAPGFDFGKYKASPRAEQQQMIGEYMSQELASDPGLRAALEQLASRQSVVPAALDLGMVLLQRARSAADPQAREKDLKRAEETFLAVGSFAWESDKYRLSLGQVYYWLGKHQEGQKLLNEFLQKHNRDSESMAAVSQLLREVGAVSEARALLEEAYAKEDDAAKKQGLATSRSVMYTDLDDKILWLGRSNSGLPFVKALLAESRGSKAAEDGNDAEAERQFTEALSCYAKVPVTSATLNNSALVHFSLYRVTHDPEQFRRGMEKLDEAVRLKPGDSLVLDNAAGVLLQATARDVVGDVVDWKALKRLAGFDLLPYLYADQAGRGRYAEKMRAHAGLAKAKGYYEKLLLLAPRRTDSYAALEWLYDYLDDLDGLRGLAKRLEGVKLDVAQYEREALDRYSGKKDAKDREDLKKALARQEEALGKARKVGGLTLAVAAGQMAASRMGASALGLPVDADGVVKLAEEAHAAAPSSGTLALRIEAHRHRAHQALAAQDKGYTELAKKTRRSLGPHLVTWALGHEGPRRDLALANADVRRVIELTLEQLKAFPDKPGVFTWAVLRASHPAEAEKVARRLKGSPREPLTRALNRAVSPLSTTVTLEAYWSLLLEGKPDEAGKLLREQAKKGVPLPAGGA